MTRTLAREAEASTIQVEDSFRMADLAQLLQLVSNLVAGHEVTVDFTHARHVDAHALSRLQQERARLAGTGHTIQLRGITRAQSRFLALLHGQPVTVGG